MGVISPTKGNLTVVDRYQARIGNGNAVSVAREIGQDLRWPDERSFSINHPVALRGGA